MCDKCKECNKPLRYQGWTNYETWNVALWIDNEEPSHLWRREETQEALEAAEPPEWMDGTEPEKLKRQATYDLAETLKEYHEEHQPELINVYGDLLGAALSEVNWHEIATHYIDEAIEAQEEATA